MIKLTRFLVAALALASASALATPKDGYYGGLLGYSVFTSSAGGTPLYGARAGYGVLRTQTGVFSLGLAMNALFQTAVNGTVTSRETMIQLSAETITREAWGTGLYLGARWGMGINSSTLDNGTNTFAGSATRFLVGPVMGYEIPVMDGASIALDVSWITAGGGTITYPGLGTFAFGSSSALNFQTCFVGHF